MITAPSLEVSTQMTPIARTFLPDLKRIAAWAARQRERASGPRPEALAVVDGGVHAATDGPTRTASTA